MGKIAVVVVHGVADQNPGVTRDQVASLLVANSPPKVDYEVTGAADMSIRTPPIELPMSDGGDSGIAETLRICKECTHGDARVKDKDLVYSTRLLQMRRKVEPGGIGQDVDIDMVEMYWADQSRLANSGSRILSELITLVFRLSRLGRDTVLGVHPKAFVTKVLWGPFAWSQWLADHVLVHMLAMLALSFAFSVAMMCALAIVASWEPAMVQNATFGAWLLLAVATTLTAVYQWPGHGKARRLVPAVLAGIFLAILALIGGLGRDPGGLGERPWFAAPEWVVFALLVSAACGVHYAILKAASQRFGVSRFLGSVFWVIALGILILTAAWDQLEHALGFRVGFAWLGDSQFAEAVRDAYREDGSEGGETRFSRLVAASVRSSEVILVLTKLLWTVAAFFVMVWFVLSVFACVAARGKYIRQGSIATGRLGFGLSMVAVLLLSMLLWAALSDGIRLATAGVAYRPIHFNDPSTQSANTNVAWVNLATTILDKGPASPAAASAALSKASDAVAEAARCRASLKTSQTRLVGGSENQLSSRVTSIDAACFMNDRYAGSTTFFSPIAAWMLVLLLFLVVMFLPSVLAEFGVKLGTPYQHGKWLTGCFRAFDAVVGLLLGVTALGVAMVFIDYVDLMNWLLGMTSDDRLRKVVLTYQSFVRDTLGSISKDWLRYMVISAASVGTVLVVFGGLLSKYVPGLRAPLDVALDVDNYFRSWPKGGAPRAMIMSRFDALLEWLEPRYDQLVVVAHSQGTVITADLLRLRVRRNMEKGIERKPIHVVTFGSPLRQLYAARFPEFYQWVLRAKDGLGGPDLRGTGIARWINCFCSGDYVGRWLWSKESKLGSADWGGVIRHPASDLPHELVAISLVETPVPYEDVDFSKVNGQDVLGNPRVECCLGYGAHTKYFDVGQTGSAWMIDSAIARASMEIKADEAAHVVAHVAAHVTSHVE